jgi:hypothetical protein
MKQLVAFITIVCFWSSLARASDIYNLREVNSNPINTRQQAAEFYLGHIDGEFLIPINVVGAVGRPGLYHIPKNTDIFRLIAAAGGFNEKADLTKITIKRRTATIESIIAINFEEALQTKESNRVVLESEDVLHIAVKEPLIDQDTLSLLTITASILSIILTSLIIRDRN